MFPAPKSFRGCIMAIRKSKRAAALFLAIFAFILFCCGPLARSAEAVVLVDDAFLAIIVAALAAFGIVFTSTGGFGTVEDFVNDLLNQHATSSGTTVSAMMSGIQTGSNGVGQILMNNRFVEFMQTFAMFIKNTYSLQNNMSIQLLSSSASVGAFKLYDLPYTFYDRVAGTHNYRYELYVGTDAYMFLEYSSSNNSSRVQPFFISNHSGVQVEIISIEANGQVHGGNYISLTGHVSGKPTYGQIGGAVFDKVTYGIEDASIYPAGSFDSILRSNYSVVGGGSYDLYLNTGTMELPYDSADYNSGDGAVLEVGAAWGMEFDDITYRVIPRTYEDAEIRYDTEEAVQEQIEDTPAQSISSEAMEYQSVGLQNVFPFCIPFDIYAFFGCLAADPVAPVINWRFYVPGIVDETITIDLSQFNTVAQVLRTMELLAFIIGLAFVTREKFLRG